MGLLGIPDEPFFPVHQHTGTIPFSVLLPSGLYSNATQTTRAIGQHTHQIFSGDEVPCTREEHSVWVVCPRLLLLFNLTRLLIIYIVPMSYCISHNSDISNQVRNKNKGAYPSNSIRFSVAFRWFFSKCLRPPTPDSFPFIHRVKKKTPKGLDIIPHI